MQYEQEFDWPYKDNADVIFVPTNYSIVFKEARVTGLTNCEKAVFYWIPSNFVLGEE